MSLSELYQEVILDHNRRPRHFGVLPDANRHALGHNPLCGDKITIHLRVVDDRVDDIMFEGNGCAISKASASLMTDAIVGLSLADAEALVVRFQDMITAPLEREPDEDALGKLSALAGVREFPVRIKCASLAWHTFRAAVNQLPTPAKTE